MIIDFGADDDYAAAIGMFVAVPLAIAAGEGAPPIATIVRSVGLVGKQPSHSNVGVQPAHSVKGQV